MGFLNQDTSLQKPLLPPFAFFLPWKLCVSKIALLIFLFFVFLGLHAWRMEVPRLGVKSELQLPTYATATATQDP